MPNTDSIIFQPHPTVHNFKDLTNQIFDHLTVLGFAGSKHVGAVKLARGFWFCQCRCGTVAEVSTGDLTSKNTKSCGCQKFRGCTKHGMARRNREVPEYNHWVDMRQRCTNPNNVKFDIYGGAGISVCPQWDDFEVFLRDVGPKPKPNYTLDRYPNRRGNYEPGNVRWATYAEQNRNHSGNHTITYNATTMCLADWAITLNINPRTLCQRLARWPLERARTEPINVAYRRR